MTKPVDLDALDKAHAEWHDDAGQRHLRDVVKYHSGRMYGGSLEFHDQARRTVDKAGECLAAMHNTYPAMAAEIRALREVAEAARAFLPTCERVIYCGATARECGAAATHESQFGVVLCDLHRSNVPRPLDPDPRVDALRAALAKVPR